MKGALTLRKPGQGYLLVERMCFCCPAVKFKGQLALSSPEMETDSTGQARRPGWALRGVGGHVRGNHSYLLKFRSIGRLPLVTGGLRTVLRGWPALPPPWVMEAGWGFPPCCRLSSHLCHRLLACHLLPGLCFKLVQEQCGATLSVSPENKFTGLPDPFPEGQAQDKAGLVGSSFPLGCGKRTVFTPRVNLKSPSKGEDCHGQSSTRAKGKKRTRNVRSCEGSWRVVSSAPPQICAFRNHIGGHSAWPRLDLS